MACNEISLQEPELAEAMYGNGPNELEILGVSDSRWLGWN